MNERINELIKQSYVTVRSQNDRDVTYFSQEKFAELIVRECAEWLKQPVNQTPLSGAVMNIAADRLKEHFGVEE